MVNEETKTQEIIALLNIYLNEYIYRNQLLWSNTFKFFYAIIIVILLPNISNFLKIELPILPGLLFRIIGLIMSFAFLFVVLGYAKRFELSSNTYHKLIKKLKQEYQKPDISSVKFGKIFVGIRTSYIVVFLMFFSLISINVILLIFDK